MSIPLRRASLAPLPQITGCRKPLKQPQQHKRPEHNRNHPFAHFRGLVQTLLRLHRDPKSSPPHVLSFYWHRRNPPLRKASPVCVLGGPGPGACGAWISLIPETCSRAAQQSRKTRWILTQALVRGSGGMSARRTPGPVYPFTGLRTGSAPARHTVSIFLAKHCRESVTAGCSIHVKDQPAAQPRGLSTTRAYIQFLRFIYNLGPLFPWSLDPCNCAPTHNRVPAIPANIFLIAVRAAGGARFKPLWDG